MYSQIISFDPSRGGTVPNLCLDNVRKGYGIGNKYSSAWEAWEHTQQHPDRNIPAGLAVPIYYAYSVSLDGTPAKNYGHINVQLPDGRVWSDGNYYASIDAYTAHHAPIFVGWGESVNDFKIIEGEDDMPNNGDVDNAYLKANGRLATDEEKKVYTSKPWGAPDGLYYGKTLVDLQNAQNAIKDEQGATYTPVTEQLFRKS